MVRTESLQVLKPIFESIWGSKFDFRHQKKMKKKTSNALKALQNESLKVLNQFLETIYEYKSYFCIFSFFTFFSYFPGIPRCSHCASLGVSPLRFPRCVFPALGSKSSGMGRLKPRARVGGKPCPRTSTPKRGKHNGENTTGRPQGKHNENNGEYQESS